MRCRKYSALIRRPSSFSTTLAISSSDTPLATVLDEFCQMPNLIVKTPRGRIFRLS
jgi:hypothetical protein